MTRSLGGPLGAQQLGQLLGDRPDRRTDHATPDALALADARDHLRRAAAALRACELRKPGDAAELGGIHAVLVDQLTALDQLARRLAT